MESKLIARTRKLSFAERWFHDGLLISNQPAFHELLEVDLSRIKPLISEAQHGSPQITYTHVLVRAAALALAANPSLHVVMAGNRVFYPSRVDIALSVNADTAVVPVLVIEGADQKPLSVIAEEVARRKSEALEAHRRLFATLNRWGWMVPFGFLRRGLLRLFFLSFGFRQKGAGTFQVSALSGVDGGATSLFSASAVLLAGEVKDRVIAVDGMPAVRPTIRLSSCADHRLWNGADCRKFLRAVRRILLSNELRAEISEQPARDQAG